eukprot:TRINITY_DN8126_c0_g1_i1.p1 TRINITY_DN8126_c0_g1~~TRINITY_DN8126_c0_g1_i1.p1  ORF type:complete len:819 (-),score=85.78 TRINITY_DN8126_c0_g1_i1:27-2483(-)
MAVPMGLQALIWAICLVAFGISPTIQTTWTPNVLRAFSDPAGGNTYTITFDGHDYYTASNVNGPIYKIHVNGTVLAQSSFILQIVSLSYAFSDQSLVAVHSNCSVYRVNTTTWALSLVGVLSLPTPLHSLAWSHVTESWDWYNISGSSFGGSSNLNFKTYLYPSLAYNATHNVTFGSISGSARFNIYRFIKEATTGRYYFFYPSVHNTAYTLAYDVYLDNFFDSNANTAIDNLVGYTSDGLGWVIDPLTLVLHGGVFDMFVCNSSTLRVDPNFANLSSPCNSSSPVVGTSALPLVQCTDTTTSVGLSESFYASSTLSSVTQLCSTSPVRAIVTRRFWSASTQYGNIPIYQDISKVYPSVPTVGAITVACSQRNNISPAVLAQSFPDGDVSTLFSTTCDTPVVRYSDSTGFSHCVNGSIASSVLRAWTFNVTCQTGTINQYIYFNDASAPTYTPLANITVSYSEYNTNQIPPPIVQDDCTDVANIVITYSDSYSDLSCVSQSLVTRTWEITDDCGKVTTADQYIFVNPPSVEIPADVIVECGNDTSTASTGTPTATGTVLSISYEDKETFLSCSPSSTIVKAIERTWNVTTTCSSVIGVQVITVVDTEDPILTVPGTAFLPCTESSTTTAPNATAYDKCWGVLEVSVTESEPLYVDVFTGKIPQCSLHSIQAKNTTRTWTTADMCQRSVSAESFVIFEDRAAPVITFRSTLPANITVSPALIRTCIVDDLKLEVPGYDNITITDNCDESPTHTISLVTSQNCGQLTITYEAADWCGNAVSIQKVVSIRSSVPPPPPNSALGVVVPFALIGLVVSLSVLI